jgi:hypothetical protein
MRRCLVPRPSDACDQTPNYSVAILQLSLAVAIPRGLPSGVFFKLCLEMAFLLFGILSISAGEPGQWTVGWTMEETFDSEAGRGGG